MKRFKFLSIIAAAFAFLFTACNGDYRELASGNTRDVVVIMDSTNFESETADAIRETFGKLVFTVPNAEPSYDLTFTSFRSQDQLDRLKKQKNIIFAAPIDEETNTARQVRGFLDETVEERVRAGESFAFPVEDQWYRDQYVLILTSTSDSALAQKIRNTDEILVNNLLEKELKRWEYFVYEMKEQVQYSDSLWENHGFKVRIQHDYIKNIDTLNFISYRRFLPQNDRWMWVWWQDDVKDISFIDNDWINSTRDSLSQQFIKGTRDSMYVNTYYESPAQRPVITNSFQKERLIAYETRGTWHMINGAMGGPFVNFTYYDPDTERLFMVEYSQFAPSVREKLPFVRQFRAMGRTFESDSTWTGEPDPGPES
ncbi:MAG: DUF4837 family protein [Balneolaceae bacterium]